MANKTTPESSGEDFEKMSIEEICDQLNEATRLFSAAEVILEHAHRMVDRARMDTFSNTVSFVVEITDPKTECFVEHDDDIVQDQPKQFVATEVFQHALKGAEYVDGRRGLRLHIRGHGFKVRPFRTEDINQIK